jgi:uncharacterized membrane protein YhiD involved in acid resistance
MIPSGGAQLRDSFMSPASMRVVTGVGFIGAGVIMHRGASLQGINSAATL